MSRDHITMHGRHYVNLGFGIYACKRQKDKNAPFDDINMVVLKPTGDFEFLLDKRSFRALKKFAKEYWRKK